MLGNVRLRVAALMSMAAALAGNSVSAVGSWKPTPPARAPKRLVPKAKMHRTGWGRKPPINGAQECARRVRQIQAGMLTMSNGLVVPGKRYLGHGVIVDV